MSGIICGIENITPINKFDANEILDILDTT